MKKLKKLTSLLFLPCCLFLCLLLFPRVTQAAESLTPTAQNNLSVGLRRTSDLVVTSNGYMRVFFKKSSVGIEYYDDSLQILSRKEIAMELPLWGGFYAGSDGYYLVEGQNNTAEDSSAEVIRVIHYDSNWNRTGAASITSNPDLFGGEVRYPFDYGCVEMAESNGKLYIVTAHQGYVDAAVGQGHQGFLLIEVDPARMTGKIVASDLWHSFAQYIKSQNSYLYVLEQSEGSRCTKLTRYDTSTFSGKTLEIFPYGGSRTSAWAVSCYASVDGMAVSSDNVLCIGTSIDQSKYDQVTEDTPHNIYLSVTPVSDFSESATTTRALTSFTDGGKSFLGAKITKVNDNRFMISWEEYEDEDSDKTVSEGDPLSTSTLHYLFVDGKGNTISKEFTTSAPISDCQPVVKDSRILYYASSSNALNFYSIDSDNGSTTKKSYHVVGENASWTFNNGVLTISGKGALSVEKEESHRFPVSSTKYGYAYTVEGPWKNLKKQIKKIVIKSGITSISEGAFSSLPAVEEVVIEKGLKEIGKEAFAYCDALDKITIPDTVTKIGDDVVWTGYSWIGSGGHVNYATIYAPYSSYAITYAKKNYINYSCDISEATVTGISKSYTYTGSAITPKPTLSIGKQKLSADNDYAVTYKNNKKAGTATVTIKGIGYFRGTLTVTFQILPASDKPQNNTSKTIRDAYNVYTINATGSTVTLKNPRSRNTTTARIPASVKANGKTYKVTSIASGAFKNCKKLKQVTIGENISKIGSYAFQDCTALRTLKIGSKVSSVGTKAFYNCKALTSVTIRSTRLTSKTAGKNAFTNAGRNNYKKLTVKVPGSKLATYKKILKSSGLSSKAKVSK